MGETSDLDGEVLGHHAVPGGKVAVDKLLGVEVGHAVGDLPGHLDHQLQGGRRPACRVMLWARRKKSPEQRARESERQRQRERERDAQGNGVSRSRVEADTVLKKIII